MAEYSDYQMIILNDVKPFTALCFSLQGLGAMSHGLYSSATSLSGKQTGVMHIQIHVEVACE